MGGAVRGPAQLVHQLAETCRVDERVALRRQLVGAKVDAGDARVQLGELGAGVALVFEPRQQVQVLERHRQALAHPVGRRPQHRQAARGRAVVLDGERQLVLAPGAVEPRVRDQEDDPGRLLDALFDLLRERLADADLGGVAPHLELRGGEGAFEKSGKPRLVLGARVADEDHREGDDRTRSPGRRSAAERHGRCCSRAARCRDRPRHAR